MSAYRFSLLEAGQEPQLMQAMQAILHETGGHNADRYGIEYWNWQYRQLPSGQAQVYVAWLNGQIVGYYHIPVYDAVVHGRTLRIGNIQDVAVSAEHRGQGTFRDLATFANAGADASPQIDLIYTFPNGRSIHTFIKYNGYQRLITYPTYVLPLRPSALLGRRLPVVGHALGWLFGAGLSTIRRSPKMTGTIAVQTQADAAIAEIYRQFSQGVPCHLVRSKDWLNWRYAHSPRGQHWFISSMQGRTVLATVVVKVDVMFGHPTLVLMDHAHASGHKPELEGLIAKIAKGHAAMVGQQTDLFFYAGQSVLNGRLGRLGFFKLPERINPRPLNLLVRNTGCAGGAELNNPTQWLVTLGDWDVL